MDMNHHELMALIDELIESAGSQELFMEDIEERAAEIAKAKLG